MVHGPTQAVVALGSGYKVSDLSASDADVTAVEDDLVALDGRVEDIEDDYAVAADVAAGVAAHAAKVTDVHGAADPVEVSRDNHTHD
jgi:hypothetical protein